MARTAFIITAIFLAFAPVLNYAGFRSMNAWDMFANTKRLCVYDLYPRLGTIEQRLNITREDFQAAPRLFVMQGREQWRLVLTALCRSRADLREGTFSADLRCFEKPEWITHFTNQPVSCERQ